MFKALMDWFQFGIWPDFLSFGMPLACGFMQNNAPAPDYTPMANASAESAKIGKELGDAQLAEGRRQYDLNKATIDPLIAKQGIIMDQSIAQGDDYFQYMKDKQRPVENALNDEAMKAGSEQLQEQKAGTAVADVRQGSTSAQNQLLRQGLRYGWSPNKLAAAGLGSSAQQGLAEATAANTARTAERNLGFAKKLDVAGLYRGLPGASSAAYGVASGAGTAGTNAQLGLSSQLMSGMNAGSNTIMSGRQLAQQGLGQILTTQGNVYAAGQDSNAAMLGSIVGAGTKLWGMK